MSTAPSVALSLAAAALVAACSLREESVAPPPSGDRPGQGALEVDFGGIARVRIVGVAGPLRPESDEPPRYQLFATGDGDPAPRRLDLVALDAVVDPHTGSLAWIDPGGTLWVAPLEDAPAGRRAVADDVILGLAAARGRLAFAIRVDGPETAPFAVELETGRRHALADGPGSDEVLGISPTADEVLIFSGRTGLASLFALGVDAPTVRQLTNVGLAPGPDLDPTAVAPAPLGSRDVAWGPRGIAYRAEGGVLRLGPGGDLERIGPDVALEEVVR